MYLRKKKIAQALSAVLSNSAQRRQMEENMKLLALDSVHEYLLLSAQQSANVE